MGQAKKLAMEWDDRGYGPVDDHAVCPTHVHDKWLADRVKECADRECTYCGQDGAASLEEVMPFVMDAIRGYYVPAIEHLDWDGLMNAPDGEDVLYDISEGSDFDEDVAHDIGEALSYNDKRWTSLREHRDGWLGAGWDRFCRWVTSQSRFLLEPPKRDDFEDGEAPQKMLDAIGQLILREGLIDTLAEKTRVYRARIVAADTRLQYAWELSAPPASLSKPGRMNSRGIPLFYGALDPQTAAIEVYDGSRRAAMGCFKTIRPLEVVDLTRLPELPSIYDAESHPRRDWLLFLAGFAEYVARPIDRDGDEDLAYLPSQAVTEYLRFALPVKARTPVHGVLFRSSRVGQQSPFGYSAERPSEGVNVVLFCGSHGALDDDQLPKESYGYRPLRRDDQWMRLDGDSAALYEYGPPSLARSGDWQLKGPVTSRSEGRAFGSANRP